MHAWPQLQCQVLISDTPSWSVKSLLDYSSSTSPPVVSLQEVRHIAKLACLFLDTEGAQRLPITLVAKGRRGAARHAGLSSWARCQGTARGSMQGLSSWALCQGTARGSLQGGNKGQANENPERIVWQASWGEA
jgi:hypothetical protein